MCVCVFFFIEFTFKFYFVFIFFGFYVFHNFFVFLIFIFVTYNALPFANLLLLAHLFTRKTKGKELLVGYTDY